MILHKKAQKCPVSRGYAKVPVIMQMEALECGAASLAMILAYYGKWIPLEQVRADCGVSRDGSNAKNLLLAARSYGLTAKGFRFEPDVLRRSGIFPCIIHWNFNHFVVLNGFKGNKACLNDPARGNYTVSMETFDKSFTGVCLLFEPGEEFIPGGSPKSVAGFVKKRMAGTGDAVVCVILATVISSLLGIVASVFPRIFMDRLLTGKNPDWLLPFVGIFMGYAAVRLLVSFLLTVYSLKIYGRFAVTGSSSYLWKVLHLPMEFFSQRMAGDIQQRQGMNASASGSLVNLFAPLLIDAAMMVFYLAVMLRYSPLLTFVGVLSILCNLGLSQLISKKRINITRVQMRDSGKLSGATVSGIEMIETIKANGAENGYFEKWAGYQASVNTQQVKYARLNQYLGLLPSLVSSLTGVAVLMLGVYLTMQGSFTVGMIMAFQGFLSSFMSPAAKLITAGQSIQEMRTQMERIEDVMEYPSDVCYGHREYVQAKEKEGAGEYRKLSGSVEMKNVTFGYSRLSEPLIEDFNLTLKPGSRVALVGASGCGKSTISKLLSGLYQPWKGEILFDGKPMSGIDRNVFMGSLAVVDQDIILFEDTIAGNIRMWDKSIEDFEVIMAARDARLHEDIMQREGGYSYRISQDGRDFSGGQRQRMEIARVLAQDPTIIIMDEATSALDARTEYEVVRSIKDRGITCIVVAHRLSTIRDCDEIIVMDHGKVVERGTHEELYAKGGAYTELVSND
ncbi:lactococcin-G-processing and transport ATP-binding protein LagD [Lachnospiraceae bacterium]|nr:lactococcin-G-processing and transport ATP-binding protein LagD [Lachnospiraceae bacterium]